MPEELEKRSWSLAFKKRRCLENPGVDPGISRMLSGRSTISANPPGLHKVS